MNFGSVVAYNVYEYGRSYSLPLILWEESDILYGELSFVNGGVERTQQPGNGSGDKQAQDMTNSTSI